MLAQRWANVGVQPLGQRWANWQIHVGPTLVRRRWPNVRVDVGPTLGQRRNASWDHLATTHQDGADDNITWPSWINLWWPGVTNMCHGKQISFPWGWIYSLKIHLCSLTHWGWVMHICISKPTIIGSDNGLSPFRCQAITWTNDDLLSIGLWGTKFKEIFIKIKPFSLKNCISKCHLPKLRPSCRGLIWVDSPRKKNHLWPQWFDNVVWLILMTVHSIKYPLSHPSILTVQEGTETSWWCWWLESENKLMWTWLVFVPGLQFSDDTFTWANVESL